MDVNPYEKAYREAREKLILRGKDVGPPVIRDGVRYSPIEGLLFPDRDVFVEAWSIEVADAILDERALMPESPASGDRTASCTECERLLLAYSFANETYMEVLHLKLETGCFRALLSDELMNALRGKCEVARQAVLDHEKTHIGMVGTATSGT